MPELPEVETVRAGLEAHVVGRTIASARVGGARAARRSLGGARHLEEGLAGAHVAAAVRRGKFVWLTLADADGTDGATGTGAAPHPAPDVDRSALLFHLGMSGQLLVRGAPDAVDLPQPRHLAARLSFTDGGVLDFVDQRTFGYLALDPLVPTADGGPGGDAGSGTAGPEVPAQVAHIARDLLDPTLDLAALVRRFRLRRTTIKRALLDQTLASGVGNIYADEALWRAKVHPERALAGMAPATVRRVLERAAEVMRQALVQGGTSFDALYVNVNGASGYFDRSLAVYGQQGRPCPRCEARIARLVFANRSSHVCPRCQRAPSPTPR
ncbi:bifunctional DNA-formamidopyrimidine glycosylase/DNA-(apurinic or apyrimidinic site) lyase [Litorihabitans aurantiacus]|uniref:Formamidopyrimidine-DNA glycosylase n=1 Tax=Litorihabitans aurantiacus TaxID=1930061 RepID=A0AA37XD86_9MICO|nr:bifunctional DNA-formamidopyrimidine glycosylase/DNA-(apurinic or apyrimidinic site) lyase [Litorihabitans aurantiacus]GMA30855.1 formamidopyrimidine-DNA glycosylase [Litorihabitans aurantiacus]